MHTSIVLADGRYSIVQKVAVGIRDCGMNSFDVNLRFLPIVIGIHFAAHTYPVPLSLVKY